MNGQIRQIENRKQQMAGWIKNHCDDKSNLNWAITSIVLKEELQKLFRTHFTNFYLILGNLSGHAPKQWLTASQQKTLIYVFFRKILIFCLILFNTKTTKLYILISPLPRFWFRSIHNFSRTWNTIQINVVQTGCNKPKQGWGKYKTAILDCFVISFSLTSFEKTVTASCYLPSTPL